MLLVSPRFSDNAELRKLEAEAVLRKIRDEGWSWARAAAFHKVSRTTLRDVIHRTTLARTTEGSGLVPVKQGRGRPRKADASAMV